MRRKRRLRRWLLEAAEHALAGCYPRQPKAEFR